MKTFAEILNALEIENIYDPDDKDYLGNYWEETEKTYTKDPYYLRPDFLSHMAKILGMRDEFKNAYFKTAELVANDPDASRLAWHLNYMYCDRKIAPRDDMPVPSRNKLGPDERMFAFIVLSGLAYEIENNFDESGIPYEYLDATFRAMDYQFQLCYDNTKSYGIWHPGWTVNYLNGGVFVIGRFIFRPLNYGGPIETVLRNIETKEVALIYSAEVDIRKDGRINGTNCIEEDDCVLTKYEENDTFILGHRVIGATVSRSAEKFPLSQWEKVFSKNDVYLEFHIAEGPSLKEDLVLSSYRKGIEFYRKYRNIDPKAFVCTSWLLDDGFDKLLPENSNILSFQRRFHIYPIWTEGNGVFNFMLLGDKDDPSTWRQDTSFQRRMKEHLLSGGFTRENGGIILPDEIYS